MFLGWTDWNYNNYVTLCIDCCISTQRAGARDGYSFFAVDSLRTTVSAPLWLKEIQRFLSIYGSVQKCSDELPHTCRMVQMDYHCQEQRQFHLDVASGTMLLACWSFIMRNIMAEYFLLSHSCIYVCSYDKEFQVRSYQQEKVHMIMVKLPVTIDPSNLWLMMRCGPQPS